MKNIDNLILREEIYAPLTTKGAPLTKEDFDNNNINIYKDFEALSQTLGIADYNALTTYDDQYEDSANPSFAVYDGRLWMWVNATPNNGVTPVDGADWQEVFPTILAHEKNNDDTLTTKSGATVRVDDSVFPRAEVYLDDSGSDWEYIAGVQDLTSFSGKNQAVIVARNSSTNEVLRLSVDDTEASLKHINTSSQTTAGIVVKDGEIQVKTPDQISGAASNGNVLQLVDASTGRSEWVDPSSTGLRIGLADYNDAATSLTPINVTPVSSPVLLTNDTLGPFTNITYLPNGVTQVWDALTNSFDWSELSLGDILDIRLDLTIQTLSVNTIIDVDLHLGTGGGAYTIPFVIQKDYKNVNTHRLVEWQSIYMGDLNTLNNGGQFKLTTDKTCNVTVNGWYCKIIKN